MRISFQPSAFAAASVPFPARTTPLASTTIGFCWPKRLRLALIAARFFSSCFRTLAGSKVSVSILTVSTFIARPPCLSDRPRPTASSRS